MTQSMLKRVQIGSGLSAVRGSMRRRSVRRFGLPALLAILIVGLFSGSTCVVVYCSEDCDPCLLQTCKCSTCSHTAHIQAVHQLDVYDLSLIVDSKNQVTRIYANILGLSLDRALGAKPHSEDDLVKFAQNVMAVNAALFPLSPADGRWVLDDVQRFESSRVATFHESTGSDGSIEPIGTGDTGSSSASFLFDAGGNLIEIDHALR